MKNLYKFWGIIAIAAVIGFTLTGCGDIGEVLNSGDTIVTFSGVIADGSAGQTTTQLTLSFSKAISGLAADDIYLSGVSGVNKGTLNGSGPIYTLPISGFTSGGTLNVAVSKSGYTISGTPKTVPIYYGAGGNNTGNPFIGTWKSENWMGDVFTIVIEANNTWSVTSNFGSAHSGTYTVSGSTATLKDVQDGYEETSTATLNGNQFSMKSHIWGNDTLAFTKNAGNNNNGGGNTAVTLSSVTANGSATQTSTQLTLTFSQAITGLSAGDITLSGVSGVNKGTLGGSGPVYTLSISGFTSGGTLSVAVAKSGYTISGSPKTATIYYYTGSSGSSNPFVGTWTGTESGTTVTLTFTETSFSFANTQAGEIFNGTYTRNGNTATLTVILDSEPDIMTATISGSTLSWEGMTFTKSGNNNSGNNNNSGSNSNPFIGTWIRTEDGATMTLTFTETSFSFEGAQDGDTWSFNGIYTRSGNTATLTSIFEGEPDPDSTTATISGSTLSWEGTTFTKSGNNNSGNNNNNNSGSNSNPFIGTWTGTADGMALTLTFTETSFTFASTGSGETWGFNGTYTRNGNTATLTVIFDGEPDIMTATISGSTLSWEGTTFTKN